MEAQNDAGCREETESCSFAFARLGDYFDPNFKRLVYTQVSDRKLLDSSTAIPLMRIKAGDHILAMRKFEVPQPN